jgi:hypothetical protein
VGDQVFDAPLSDLGVACQVRPGDQATHTVSHQSETLIWISVRPALNALVENVGAPFDGPPP